MLFLVSKGVHSTINVRDMFPYALVIQDGSGVWPYTEFYGNITAAARGLFTRSLGHAACWLDK